MEMYATKAEYESLYPNAPSDSYDRFSWSAQKYIDNATTTVDGVKKLQKAFPSNEDDAEAVKRCECAIINALSEIDAMRAAMNAANAYTDTGNGFISSTVKSLSAGGESVTYGMSAETTTDLVNAARSVAMQSQYVNGIISDYLRGVSDANGVSLLFGGRYPGVICRVWS